MASSNPNATINWQEADVRFDELFQPALQSTSDQSLTGYRRSQQYLAGRYAAIRVRHANVEEIRQWIFSGTETWKGFIEGLESP